METGLSNTTMPRSSESSSCCQASDPPWNIGTARFAAQILRAITDLSLCAARAAVFVNMQTESTWLMWVAKKNDVNGACCFRFSGSHQKRHEHAKRIMLYVKLGSYLVPSRWIARFVMHVDPSQVHSSI